jgi:hypothetical protein
MEKRLPSELFCSPQFTESKVQVSFTNNRFCLLQGCPATSSLDSSRLGGQSGGERLPARIVYCAGELMQLSKHFRDFFVKILLSLSEKTLSLLPSIEWILSSLIKINWIFEIFMVI